MKQPNKPQQPANPNPNPSKQQPSNPQHQKHPKPNNPQQQEKKWHGGCGCG